MSDLENQPKANTPADEAQAKTPEVKTPVTPPVEAVAKPAAKPPVEPPPPPPPGFFGELLDAAGLGLAEKVTHLGPDAYGIEMISVSPKDLLKVAQFLKEDSRCVLDLLISVSGVDWKDRLEAVYHVFSTETYKKLAIKVTADQDHIPSVMPVWPAADWHEREAYDLYGIYFDGHPNLIRILMPNDWIGHPMRKDYKVTDPRLVWNER
ncbi:MAG: NADH-quinone oxidoreductase subunit C [Cyanobacteria bacterium]|nr:NADH-quinone oxidoreductase subunit C [Cyanobacteriota bacterium]